MKIKYTPLAIILSTVLLTLFFSYYQQVQKTLLTTTTTFVITSTISVTTTTTPFVYNPKCREDSDCGWEAANCCNENSGAKWECVKKGKFFEFCSKNAVLCPQVLSPKPTNSCLCVNQECVAK